MSRPAASPVVVAIHQPNFFPWLGYFAKIAACDVFVFLDQVDYPKSGKSMGSYVNRVKIAAQGQALWWSCPAQRESGAQPIDTVRIKDEPWVDKRLKTLEQSYAKAPFFRECIGPVRDMVARPEPLLSEYNKANIRALCELIGLSTRFVSQSDMGVPGAATERLVGLVSALEGGVYLSGAGGGNYQEEETFARAGIELRYRGFAPRPYVQAGAGEFLPGLSVLDALFNLGPQGVREQLSPAPTP